MAGISKNNPRIKELRRLLRDPKFRSESKKFAAEGLEVVKECIATSHCPLDVFVVNGHPVSKEVELVLAGSEASIWYLEESLISSLATTVAPQPVISIFQSIDIVFEDLIATDPTFLIFGEEIREPGNAGSLLRTAAAASADGVILSENTVDLYNPKTIRSSAGSIFRIPIVRSTAFEKLSETLRDKSITTVALSPTGDLSYLDYDFTSPFVVLLGNESSGLSTQALNQADEIIRIRMGSGVESLNVSNAASVVLFEAHRQRYIKQ